MNKQIKYALWRRVSTKEQGKSGLGLEAQTAIATHFYGEPQAVFTDVYSGTKLRECEELQKAKQYCKQHNIPLVVAKCDRVRNVIQGLELLDDMGEGNLMFCDIGTADRTVLTMMFAIYERQAIIGRLNTKLALNERKKQAERDGAWISKAGNICTHLGREKGCDMSKANEASSSARMLRAERWRAESKAVAFAKRKFTQGVRAARIVEELGELYDAHAGDDVNPYATPQGAKPTRGIVSKWLHDLF